MNPRQTQPREARRNVVHQTWVGILLLLVMMASVQPVGVAATLTTLEYKIFDTQLKVSPPSLSVPKGVPGSVQIDLTGTTGPENSYVEAILRGPSFPARRVVGQANAPLLLPPLPLVGDYELDGIRLVDSTGSTVLEGSPNSVPVHVFDDVLI